LFEKHLLCKKREGEWAWWEMNDACGKGLICSVEIKARQACQGKYRRVSVGIDTVASRHVLPIVYDLRSPVDLASCSGGFLREQMRGFYELLRERPTSSPFVLLG
jgi:hypothetical protein